MESNIDLKSIQELSGYKFNIPNYQRGYRWTPQQVKDLLNDIFEFQQNGAKGIYCMQPLVVKKNNSCWDVIDGQQRLTTIYILLSYLKQDTKYSIEYETRKKGAQSNSHISGEIGSKEFLEHITEDTILVKNESEKLSDIANVNIDYFHMLQAYETINQWFDTHIKDDEKKKAFLTEEKVKFIWYETAESDSIKVFTRLNVGKIALTDAELIKALFLNSSNFKSKNDHQIRLEQVEIASEWDRIENSLQNDEFWLFINNLDYSKPTRIDYIFDIIRDQDIFKLKDKLVNYDEAIGNDEHRTFRYFYEYFKQDKQNIDSVWLRKTWQTIKDYYQVFEEWYNDLELYHYVGYLIAIGKTAPELKEKYIVDHYCPLKMWAVKS